MRIKKGLAAAALIERSARGAMRLDILFIPLVVGY
jgi:hypothetical protein